MGHIAFAAATTIISVGTILTTADAADLYTMPPPPPAAEAPPPAEVAPPRVAVIPEARVLVPVEPRCPIVWRCGYWGCGWREACAPVTADVYEVIPSWRYRAPYREYHRPWGYSHPRWGYRHHWAG